jgi:hypothetical protein
MHGKVLTTTLKKKIHQEIYPLPNASILAAATKRHKPLSETSKNAAKRQADEALPTALPPLPRRVLLLVRHHRH